MCPRITTGDFNVSRRLQKEDAFQFTLGGIPFTIDRDAAYMLGTLLTSEADAKCEGPYDETGHCINPDCEYRG